MKKIKTTVAAVLAATMVLSSSIVAFAGQWQQEGTAWKYQNDDNTYTANGWQWIDGKRYYFDANGYMAANKWIGNYYVGSNGAMLTNTTTPDGYQVGGDGAWIQNQGQKQNDGVHTKRFGDIDAILSNNINPMAHYIDTNGNSYGVISDNVTSISFSGADSNIDTNDYVIEFAAFKYNPLTKQINVFSNDGTTITQEFKYDTVYNFQLEGVNATGKDFVDYCKQNDIMLLIGVGPKDQAGRYTSLYCYE